MIFEFLYIFVCLCSVAFLSLVLVALIVSRKLKSQVGQLFSDDIEHLEKRERIYRIDYPDENDDEILSRVVRREALIAGVIGFVTGIGGLLTLPIALPIDILSTIRIQYRLVEFLLSKNIENRRGVGTDRLKVLAIVFGSSRLSSAGGKVVIATVTKYAPQVVLKGIPIIGGVVGFLIDYMSTKTVARLAMREFSTHVNVNKSLPKSK